MPREMFAEAVADIYAHGNQARQMSVELVKEYEKRAKKRLGKSTTRTRNPVREGSWDSGGGTVEISLRIGARTGKKAHKERDFMEGQPETICEFG